MKIKIKQSALSLYRLLRTFYKRQVGIEPKISVKNKSALEYHGNNGYGGWAIPKNSLTNDSVVVDVGLGEDISFSISLIEKYKCIVHGFDPTPKSIDYVKKKSPVNFILYEIGVAGSTRIAKFFLPVNPSHVSGSLTKSNHVGRNEIDVNLVDLSEVLFKIKKDRIDLLKIDIEGSEYELLNSDAFRMNANRISILCIEFHHRWAEFGSNATLAAVENLNHLGFECVWRSCESNEEFTFINTKRQVQPVFKDFHVQ